MQLEYEILMSTKENVDTHCQTINTILNSVVDGYTSELDSLIDEINKKVINEKNPSTSVVEEYFMKLSSMIYYVAGQVEGLGTYDGMSKISYKDKFNKTMINDSVDPSSGKKRAMAELTALAEDNAVYDGVINDMYSRAYKIIKAKLDAADTLCGTLSKVLSHRMQEDAHTGAVESQNMRRILNESSGGGNYFG